MASSESNVSFDQDTMEMLSANLPQHAFLTSTPDPRLEKARQDAERTNQITPVLKEELRLLILNRRWQQGEPEIETTPVEPKQYELTEDEKEKKEKRKAQNRRAAKKCREKRKMKNLSDAEKYNVMKEEQQRLKNDLMLLRHKEEVLRKFCMEHIFQGKCQHPSNDNSDTVRLQALLGHDVSQMIVQPQVPLEGSHLAAYSSVHYQPELPSHSLASTSVPSTALSDNHRDSPVCESSSRAVGVKGVASDDLFDKHAATAQLHNLQVEEISTLLPPDTELSLSDHSLESTPPIMSPTNLFSTMSPTPGATLSSSTANSSYFKNDLTPSSSSSAAVSTTDTSDEMNNSMEILNKSSGSHAVYFCTIPCTGTPRKAEYICKSEIPLQHFTQKFSPVSPADGGSDIILNSLADREQQDSEQPIMSNPLWAGSSTLEDDDSHDIPGVSPALVNSTLFQELSPEMEILQYFSAQEQNDQAGQGFSQCEGQAADQTIPISPLTPLSPLSPCMTQPSLSPSPYSTDAQSQNNLETPALSLTSNPGRFQSSSSLVTIANASTGKSKTAARPVMRRTSSTASVPSPYLSHQLSNSSLSPPPSVPSPASHGVPESPSILSGYVACDENTYHPQLSPVGSVSSAEFGQVRVRRISGEDSTPQ